MNATAEGKMLPRVDAVHVRTFRPNDAAAWAAYVERAASATFFHRIEWRAILEEEFRHRTYYQIAERAGHIVGVLPLAQVRSRLFGHSLVSLPFAAYGGPVADDADSTQALIDAGEAIGRDLGADRVELRNRAVLQEAWPRQSLYVTFRKAIDPEVEANMLAVPRKQRAMIRKGAKHGLVSEIDGDARRFFALYADNVHRHGTPPFAQRYFERLLATFRPGLRSVDGRRRRRKAGVGRAFVLLPRRGAAVLRRRHQRGAGAGRERLQVLGADAPGLRARRPRVRLRPEQAGLGQFRLQDELGLRAHPAGLRVPPLPRRLGAPAQSGESEIRCADRHMAQVAARVVNAIGPHLVRVLG